MKIALFQHNFTINDIEYNVRLIKDAIATAHRNNADLAVFSELSICGYPPQDLLEREDFVSRCLKAVDEVAKECVGIAAIVGAPSINPAGSGKQLYNSAFFLENGKVADLHHKGLLPTYDIFDEYRYFEPSREFHTTLFKGHKLAITICEDIWDDQPVTTHFGKSRLYPISPMEALSKESPDIIINIAASPFSNDINQRRKEVFLSNVGRYGLPVVYVNQVGANTDLIFDGSSMVVNSKGEVVFQMKAFEEDSLVIDTNQLESAKPHHPIASNRIESIHEALVLGIRDYFRKMGFKKATLGLSGGIDSAVVLCLAAKAIGSENIRVLLMPSRYSSDHSVKDAEDLAKNLGVQYDIVGIELMVKVFEETLAPLFTGRQSDITEENIQARIRGTLLMSISNKFGHLLLNTTNKSEAAVGYGTLYGDMNGAISVLGDVYKTDVFQLARYINRNAEIIPTNTITKPPSAELRPDQKDSDSLPDYDTLDAILFRYIEKQGSIEEIIAEGFSDAVVKRTTFLVDTNEYKRFQFAPVLRVSSKAFGAGRRIPLVAKFKR